jgi:hypothetical protein
MTGPGWAKDDPSMVPRREEVGQRRPSAGVSLHLPVRLANPLWRLRAVS